MAELDIETHERLRQSLSELQLIRYPWWKHWRDLADYYLPRRYVWLLSGKERSRAPSRNTFILDPTGTLAARTLASGMMNGITSPSRPWFRLRVANFEDDENSEIRRWLDEVTRRMLLVMAESNFYNALAILYLDLSIFGSGSMLIYEDFDDVIRCYNNALGEFYLAQNERQEVNVYAREFCYDVQQTVRRWGEDNVTDSTKAKWKQGGANRYKDVDIVHMIEPNDARDGLVPARFAFREYYWEKGAPVGTILGAQGFMEMPGVFPRWEIVGNDAYGSSPGMDALPDVIQLQHETKKKAQGLDKLVDPPVLADVQLQHKPTALLPRGITYVAGVNNVGVKPVYTVDPPVAEMTADIREVQGRIRETFHNDLFRMISQLDTVRSATEIDARREEKLVLLGSVLERFENEALDPAINRIFNIMARSGLLPEVPEGFEQAELEIQYVSVLSDAQRAVGTIPIERFLTFTGNVSALYPKAVNIPNWDALIREYGTAIGVPSKGINSREETAGMDAQADELAATREAAAVGQELVGSAKLLSETEVGGGEDTALTRLLGG